MHNYFNRKNVGNGGLNTFFGTFPLIDYRQPSLYAVFLSAILHIRNPEMASFLKPILWFTVILGLFICEFVICKPIFGVPMSRI